MRAKKAFKQSNTQIDRKKLKRTDSFLIQELFSSHRLELHTFHTHNHCCLFSSFLFPSTSFHFSSLAPSFSLSVHSDWYVLLLFSCWKLVYCHHFYQIWINFTFDGDKYSYECILLHWNHLAEIKENYSHQPSEIIRYQTKMGFFFHIFLVK